MTTTSKPIASKALTYGQGCAICVLTGEQLGLVSSISSDVARTILKGGTVHPSHIGWLFKTADLAKSEARRLNLVDKAAKVAVQIAQKYNLD